MVSRQKNKTKKLFVLDTNVLLHDPTCLYHFQEHDVFIPMVTLEELDTHKKGMTEVARNARQASRFLEEMVCNTQNIEAGIPLSTHSKNMATGKLFLQAQGDQSALTFPLSAVKADNHILSLVMALKKLSPDRPIILVSKDINMRVKARALGLAAEDYFNDKVLEDSDLLYTGAREIDPAFWERNGKNLKSWQEHGRSYYQITGPDVGFLYPNQMLWQEQGNILQARVIHIEGKTAVLETLKDFSHQKNSIWGITARNREQNFAFNILMNPDIDFVSLLGQAGTGKTLLALAAGLNLVLEHKRYAEIIMTRATVPVGEDIGFLPGTEEEKMTPWMGALEDNLDVLNKSDAEAVDWGRAATRDLIRSRIKIKSLNFMRGRTFLNKYLILDEAQNLTPKQMKTLITRAGPGTKVVCLGNISQIDTPYLTEGSSGLTYVVDRFKHWEYSGHVTLQRGERSRLAEYAAETL